MSLTKEVEIGKIEVTNKWSVHVRLIYYKR